MGSIPPFAQKRRNVTLCNYEFTNWTDLHNQNVTNQWLPTHTYLLSKMTNLTKEQRETFIALAIEKGARYELVCDVETTKAAIYDAKESLEDILERDITEEEVQSVLADIPSQFDNYEMVYNRYAENGLIGLEEGIEFRLKE